MVPISDTNNVNKILMANARLFFDLTKDSQRKLAKKLHMGLNTLSDILTGIAPKRDSVLERFSQWCSDISGIPFSEFDGGKALLEKNFEEIVTSYASERDLQKDSQKSRIPDSDTINGREQIERLTTGQDFTENELGLLAFIRKQTYGNPDVPLTDAEIISLKRLIGTVGGSVERHRIIVDMLMNLRGWDAGLEERKRIQDQHRKRLDDEVD